jgi:hypothetical protein
MDKTKMDALAASQEQEMQALQKVEFEIEFLKTEYAKLYIDYDNRDRPAIMPKLEPAIDRVARAVEAVKGHVRTSRTELVGMLPPVVPPVAAMTNPVPPPVHTQRQPPWGKPDPEPRPEPKAEPKAASDLGKLGKKR